MLSRLFPLILIGLLTVGCAQVRSISANQRVGFEVYYQKFQTYSAQYGRKLFSSDTGVTIVFSSLEETEAGLCQQDSDGGRKVLIDKAKWDAMDEGTREVLVFHELGHCLLGRGHLDGNTHIGDGATGITFLGPKSLMSSTAVPGAIFKRNTEYYLDELFAHPAQ